MVGFNTHAIFADFPELAAVKGSCGRSFLAEYLSVKAADEAVAITIDSDTNYHSVSTSSSFFRACLSCLASSPFVLSSSTCSLLTHSGFCHCICQVVLSFSASAHSITLSAASGADQQAHQEHRRLVF
jgi:hypothetical protein